MAEGKKRRKSPEEQRREAAERAMAMARLDKLGPAERSSSELSAGEQARQAQVKAATDVGEVDLLDEPEALDAEPEWKKAFEDVEKYSGTRERLYHKAKEDPSLGATTTTAGGEQYVTDEGRAARAARAVDEKVAASVETSRPTMGLAGDLRSDLVASRTASKGKDVTSGFFGKEGDPQYTRAHDPYRYRRNEETGAFEVVGVDLDQVGRGGASARTIDAAKTVIGTALRPSEDIDSSYSILENRRQGRPDVPLSGTDADEPETDVDAAPEAETTPAEEDATPGAPEPDVGLAGAPYEPYGFSPTGEEELKGPGALDEQPAPVERAPSEAPPEERKKEAERRALGQRLGIMPTAAMAAMGVGTVMAPAAAMGAYLEGGAQNIRTQRAVQSLAPERVFDPETGKQRVKRPTQNAKINAALEAYQKFVPPEGMRYPVEMGGFEPEKKKKLAQDLLATIRQEISPGVRGLTGAGVVPDEVLHRNPIIAEILMNEGLLSEAPPVDRPGGSWLNVPSSEQMQRQMFDPAMEALDNAGASDDLKRAFNLFSSTTLTEPDGTPKRGAAGRLKQQAAVVKDFLLAERIPSNTSPVLQRVVEIADDPNFVSEFAEATGMGRSFPAEFGGPTVSIPQEDVVEQAKWEAETGRKPLGAGQLPPGEVPVPVSKGALLDIGVESVVADRALVYDTLNPGSKAAVRREVYRQLTPVLEAANAGDAAARTKIERAETLLRQSGMLEDILGEISTEGAERRLPGEGLERAATAAQYQSTPQARAAFETTFGEPLEERFKRWQAGQPPAEEVPKFGTGRVPPKEAAERAIFLDRVSSQASELTNSTQTASFVDEVANRVAADPRLYDHTLSRAPVHSRDFLAKVGRREGGKDIVSRALAKRIVGRALLQTAASRAAGGAEVAMGLAAEMAVPDLFMAAEIPYTALKTLTPEAKARGTVGLLSQSRLPPSEDAQGRPQLHAEEQKWAALASADSAEAERLSGSMEEIEGLLSLARVEGERQKWAQQRLSDMGLIDAVPMTRLQSEDELPSAEEFRQQIQTLEEGANVYRQLAKPGHAPGEPLTAEMLERQGVAVPGGGTISGLQSLQENRHGLREELMAQGLLTEEAFRAAGGTEESYIAFQRYGRMMRPPQFDKLEYRPHPGKI